MRLARQLSLPLLAAITLTAAAPRTFAQPADSTKVACREAYEQAQLNRRNNELTLARQKLRFCAGETCPAVARTDCVKWLDQVEKALPSIVLEAKGDEGDVFDVAVTMDDTLIASKLEGRPIEVDPGVHVFVFRMVGKPPIVQKVIIKENEKSRSLSASWVTPKPAQESSSGSVPALPMVRPVPATVFIAGSIGIVGIASFVFFGVSGNSKRTELQGSCAPFCSDDQISSIKSRYLIGDISLGVGAVALASAAVLYLTRPERPILETPVAGSALNSLGVRPLGIGTGAAPTGGVVEWCGGF